MRKLHYNKVLKRTAQVLQRNGRHAWTWWRNTGQYQVEWRRGCMWLFLLGYGVWVADDARADVLAASVTARLFDTTLALAAPCLLVTVVVEALLMSVNSMRSGEFVVRIIQRGAVLVWLLTFVAALGPMFEELAHTSPQDAAIAGGALLLIVIMLRQVPVRFTPWDRVHTIVPTPATDDEQQRNTTASNS